MTSWCANAQAIRKTNANRRRDPRRSHDTSTAFRMKKAMVAAMLMGSTAFWLGTAIGLCIFELMFDVPPDVKERVLHASYVGLAAMYISVMAGIVHVVFFRDRHLWSVDALDRAL